MRRILLTIIVSFIVSAVVSGALLYAGPSIFSVYQGGTGKNTLTAHGVLLGQGTSPITAAAPLGTANCFMDNGTGSDPSFQPCASGSGNAGICSANFGSLSGWTWANQGTSTATITSNVLTFTGQNVFNQFQLRFLYISAPPTPWTKVMCFAPDIFSFSGEMRTGLAISDGTKLVTFMLTNDNAQRVQVEQWNTLFNNAHQVQLNPQMSWSNPIAIEVGDDGTNVTMSICVDGVAAHCRQVFQDGRSAWLTSPTQVGMVATSANSSNSAIMYVYSFQ